MIRQRVSTRLPIFKKLKNKPMTKEQQFKQEDRAISNDMDRRNEKWDKLTEDNKILLSTMKEIAVRYPDNMSAEQDNILCKYLIAIAQDAIRKVEPEPIKEETNMHPIFKNIADTIFNPIKSKKPNL